MMQNFQNMINASCKNLYFKNFRDLYLRSFFLGLLIDIGFSNCREWVYRLREKKLRIDTYGGAGGYSQSQVDQDLVATQK